MKNIHYMTLAAARLVDSEKFDQAIKLAVSQAAHDVGRSVVINAMSPVQRSIHQKAA